MNKVIIRDFVDFYYSEFWRFCKKFKSKPVPEVDQNGVQNSKCFQIYSFGKKLWKLNPFSINANSKLNLILMLIWWTIAVDSNSEAKDWVRSFTSLLYAHIFKSTLKLCKLSNRETFYANQKTRVKGSNA